MTPYVLYKIEFPSGKLYFGITSNLQRRRYDHTYCAFTRKSKLTVHCAMRRYGRDNYRITPLVVGSEDYIKDLEIRAITAFKAMGHHGYNMTPGGDLNPSLAPEVIQRSAASRKGQAVSDETRQRLRAAHLGKKASDQTRAKMSAALRKRVVTPETRKKLSAAAKIRTVSKETKDKLSLIAIERNKLFVRNERGQFLPLSRNPRPIRRTS